MPSKKDVLGESWVKEQDKLLLSKVVGSYFSWPGSCTQMYPSVNEYSSIRFSGLSRQQA